MNLLINLPFVNYPVHIPPGILDKLNNPPTEPVNTNHYSEWIGFWMVVTPILLFFLWRGIKKLLIVSKQWKVNKLIRHFSEQDPFWDINSMRDMARNLFFEVQSAWRFSHFRSIAPLLTDKIKTEWMDTWKQMKQNQYVFMVGSIDIRSVKVISAEDHFDDYQDQFKVEISGYIKRFVKNKPDDSWYVKSFADYEEFTDIYSFVRQDDQWLLNDIHHGANIVNVMTVKNKNFHLQ